MAMELTDVTPTMKSIPIFKLPKKELSPIGITVMINKVGATNAMGANVKTGLSASVGMVSSFIMSFTTSANGWKMPKGPFLLGPRLT